MNDDSTPPHDSTAPGQPPVQEKPPWDGCQPAYPGPPAYPGQPVYPSQPGYDAGQPVGELTGGWHHKPKHPQATTALVLGISSLASTILCFLLWPVPLVLSVVAWVVSSKALSSFNAAPDTWDGRNEITTGRALGVVGTILNIVLLVAFIGFMALAIATRSATDDYYYSLLRIG